MGGHIVRVVLAALAVCSCATVLLAETEHTLRTSGYVAEQDAEPGAAISDDAEPAVTDPLEMEIKQLRRTSIAPALDVEVSTVARQPSTVGRSATAVYVVTPEMIRRSGAQTVPEVLRMVPGLQVAHRDSNKWAVSSRGFNNTFANKLLVQIDGRTVYTPVFAGTYWDVPDVVLEDIERIEVIRGPGATIWGANAVNGVINIITKSSKDTTGIYAKAGGGTEENGFGTVRAGGCQGDVAWRGYFKWFERDRGFAPGGPAHDDWRQNRGGFRADWNPNRQDTIMLQGDIYSGNSGTTFFGHQAEDQIVQGHHVLTRWSRVLDDSTDWSFQVYYDASDRSGRALSQHVEVFDIDYQYRLPIGCRHNVIWGLGYRRVGDSLVPTAGFSPIRFVPPDSVKNLASAFVQDEITLRDDSVYLTIGSKFEDNDFTGFEIQPSIRLIGLLSERQAAWASISRAVRTPSRVDAESVIFTFQGNPGVLGPSPSMLSEELIAYELGYRAQPSERFSWEIALFYNVYENLRSRRVTGGGGLTQLELFNASQGHGYGFEIVGDYRVTDCWKLTAWYSLLQLQLDNIDDPPQSTDDPARIEDSSPQNQVFLMSSWDLGHHVEFDAMARYVDVLQAQSVPSYLSLDLRLGWQPTKHIELSLVGQNLLDQQHLEFGNVEGLPTPPVEIQRSMYGYLTWRY